MKFVRSRFSLIELLVVIGIIAALTAIVIPTYRDYISMAKINSARENLRVYRKALDDFKADIGRFPKFSSIGSPSSELLLGKDGSGRYPYLRSLPLDPYTNSTGSWKIHPKNDCIKDPDPAVGSTVANINHSDPLINK